jgi:Na+-translocating ferredoxin:NAD+ oxidoreductase RnfG subunit
VNNYEIIHGKKYDGQILLLWNSVKTLRIIGVRVFAHHPGLKKLEHDISETGSVSALR